MINKTKKKSKILFITTIVICISLTIVFLLINEKAEEKVVVLENEITLKNQNICEDQILAYVNSFHIYDSEIDQALKIDTNSDEKELLHYRIREELVFQEKENLGIEITDNIIDESINDFNELDKAYYLVFENIYEMDLSLNDNIQCIAFDFKNIDFKIKKALEKELYSFCKNNNLVYISSTIDELKENGYIVDDYFEHGILIKFETLEKSIDHVNIYGEKFRSSKASVSAIFNLTKDTEWKLKDTSEVIMR